MKRALHIFTFFFLILSGCQPSGEDDMDAYVATALAETAALEALIAEGAAATIAAIPTETLTPIPTPTLTPTITPTMTPFPPVTATVVLNAYCRPGPDVIYGVGKLLHRGDSVTVVGRVDDEANWLLVQPANGSDTCWIASEALSIAGEATWVEIVLAPPTPTPIPSWTGTWTTWYNDISANEREVITILSQTGDQVSGFMNRTAIQGTVSADGMTITGTLDPGYNYAIFLERDPYNPHIFRGRITWLWGVSPFCGTRLSGDAKPSPCLP